MESELKFIRRLVPKRACNNTSACPDIFELNDGSFAIVGSDITHEAGKLPADAGCASNERIVRVPRELLVRAKTAIPDGP